MPDKIESKKILDVRIDFGLKMEDVLNICEEHINNSTESKIISTTNPEFIMHAQNDLDFKQIINNCFLSLPDGSGILMAGNYLAGLNRGKNKYGLFKKLFLGLNVGLKSLKQDKKEETITGVELTERVCQLSSEKGYSIFFLGGALRDKKGIPIIGQKDLSTMAAEKMRKRYPNVNIIGSTSDFSPDEKNDNEIVKYIKGEMNKYNISYLDFIFVACGQSKQEKWINRNINKIPAKIGVGVGRTFDYLSNYVQKPPAITYKYNISWLYSLISEPWRLKRVLTAFPIFPLKVFIDSLKNE